MRLFLIAGTLVLVLHGVAGGQQQDATSNPSIPSQYAGKPKIYETGPDVTAPVLLPLNVPLTPPSACKNKLDGKVKLSLLVDENGRRAM